MADEADWYRFRIGAAATSAHYVRVNFTHSQGDIDLRIYKSDGVTEIDHSTGTGNTEEVSLSGQPAGIYYIKVYPYGSRRNPSYSLAINPPAAALDDAYEDNDSKSIVDGRPEGAANSSNLGTITDQRVISGLRANDSADWYRFRIGAAGSSSHRLRIDFTHSTGDIDMILYRADGTTEVDHSTGTTNSEEISLAGQPAGIYYIKIYPYGTPRSNTYTLTLNAPSAPANAPDMSPFQPSGWSDRIVVSTATGDHADAASFASTETLYVDWAAINNGQSAVTIPYDAKLYVDGVQSGWWTNTGLPLNPTYYTWVDDHSIGTLAPGPHTIEIVIDEANALAEFSESNNRYSRTITVTDRPALCIDDAQITEGNLGSSMLTFTVHLSSATASPVTLRYLTANGTASTGSDYQASGGTLQIPAGQTSATFTVAILGDRTPENDEVFYVNLTDPVNAVITDAQATGTITNDDAAAPVITPDWAEANDSFATAYRLASSAQTYGGLTIHSGADQDYFRWTAPADGTLIVQTRSRDSRGDLDLYIHDAAGAELATSASSSSNESITRSVAAGQTYVFHVQNFAEAVLSGYDLIVDLQSSTAQADLTRIIYQDGAGRKLDYNFAAGSAGAGSIEIPDSAILARAAGELAAGYRLVPWEADLQLDTAAGVARFGGVDGLSTLWATGLADIQPDTFNYAAYFCGFHGLGSEDASHRVSVGLFSTEGEDAVYVRADWDRSLSGGLATDTLSLRLIIENTDTGRWISDPIVFASIDPSATSLDLRVESADGDSVAGLYRLNGGIWQTIAEQPIEDGWIAGLPVFAPTIAIESRSGSADTTHVTVTADDAAASEEAANAGQFVIARTGDTDSPLTVYYTITGTASPSDHSELFSGAITIPAGLAQTTLRLTPIDDDVIEDAEHIVLTLRSDAAYAVGAPDSATITIADNDVAPGEIRGAIWNDADGDGVRDADEEPLVGWTIGLDTDNNGIADTTRTTDNSGLFVFANLAPGSYILFQQPFDGWSATAPASGSRSVSVAAGQIVTDADFGYKVEAPRGNNYAILFSGGANAQNNHKRYYDNVKYMYYTLVDYCGLSPENIYILYADGRDPGADMNPGDGRRPVNSNMSYAPNVYPATWSNLNGLFSNLGGELGPEDHFLFWSFDHGSGDSGNTSRTGEESLVGWGEFISDEYFSYGMSRINAGYQSYVFAQCFAGGMLDDFLPMSGNTFGCAAANHYEPSYGDYFARAFSNALRQGYRTSHQAFDYAFANDPVAVRGGPGGALRDYVEHPWSAGGNFEIFTRHSNAAPNLLTVNALQREPGLQQVTISYDTLLAHAKVTDPDGDAISFRIQSVLNGTLTTADGQPVQPGITTISFGGYLLWTRTDGNSTPLDAFTITATDGLLTSASAVTVRVGASATNDLTWAVDDEFSIDEDSADMPLNVLANDTGHGTLSITRIGSPSHGTATLINGQILYSPLADYVGKDTFTYITTDQWGITQSATVSLTILPQADAPMATRDDFVIEAAEGAAFLDVLQNDFDPDLQQLSLLAIEPPAHGSVEILDGRIRYIPALGYGGADTFTYTVGDPTGRIDTATVDLTINQLEGQSPILTLNPEPLSYTQRNAAAAIDSGLTLADGDSAELLGAAVVISAGYISGQDMLAMTAQPAIMASFDATTGTLTLTGKADLAAYQTALRAVTFSTSNAVNSSRTFSITLSDGVNTGPAATRTLSIQIPNTFPDAVNDAGTLQANGATYTVYVLNNDTDPDGDTLTVTAVTAASHGSASLENELVLYRPHDGFVGIDSFTYTISDGRGGTDTAAVTVTVKAPDNVRPAGQLLKTVAPKTGATAWTVKVRYSDNILLAASSIGGKDLLVVGPRKFKQYATLIARTPSANARTITATYRLRAPGGRFDKTDNGLYSFYLQPAQIADTAGNTNIKARLGAVSYALSRSVRAAQAARALSLSAQPFFCINPVHGLPDADAGLGDDNDILLGRSTSSAIWAKKGRTGSRAG